MATYITNEGLEHLKTHEYKRTPPTTLDRILNDWLWNPAVLYIPRWIAPNVITLIGFLLLASSVAIILFYDTSLSKELPRWVYFYAAVAVFAYQGLDAIDGKQARITGTTTPLGQFFDHLCDAFACTCLSIIGCQLLRLGSSFLSLALQCTINVIFFLADWEYLHIDTFRSGMGGVGVIEAQWAYIISLLVTSVYGAGIWAGYLPFLVSYLVIFGAVVFAIGILRKVLKNNKQKLRSLSLLVPDILIVWLSVLWGWTEYYKAQPALVILAVGLEFFLMSAKIIVVTMCKMNFSAFQIEPWFLLVPTICTKIGIPSSAVYGAVLIVITIRSFTYVVGIIDQMATFLGIRCFSIVRLKDSEDDSD